MCPQAHFRPRTCVECMSLALLPGVVLSPEQGLEFLYRISSETFGPSSPLVPPTRQRVPGVLRSGRTAATSWSYCDGYGRSPWTPVHPSSLPSSAFDRSRWGLKDRVDSDGGRRV